MKTLLFLLFSFGFPFLGFAQPGDIPPTAEPGKCYAKCMILKAPEEVTETFPVYIGSEADAPGLISISLVYEKAQIKWVDKLMPNGQTEHCLVEIPKATEEISIVEDTTGRTDYVFETFTFYQNPPRSKYTDWREVVCNNRLNDHLVKEVQRALITKGFYQGELTGRIDKMTKAALARYQKYTYLPIGNVDVETLEALEIFSY